MPEFCAGKPSNPKGINEPHCTRARNRHEVGIERITPHAGRHTFASLMIAARVNAKALSTFMCHATISITLDRYGHLVPGSEEEAAGLFALISAYSESASRRRHVLPAGQWWDNERPFTSSSCRLRLPVSRELLDKIPAGQEGFNRGDLAGYRGRDAGVQRLPIRGRDDRDATQLPDARGGARRAREDMNEPRKPHNPLRNERDMFRVLIQFGVAAAIVIAVALLISSLAGAILGAIFVAIGLWRTWQLIQEWRRYGSDPAED